NLTAVSAETLSLKRTWKPTAPPSGTCSSSATRRATARAAIRRGWVQAIMPAAPRPAARHSLGSWVILPEPVSPAMTTTGLSRISATMSSACAAIGSAGSTAACGSRDARACRRSTDCAGACSNAACAAASPGAARQRRNRPCRRATLRLQAPWTVRCAGLDATLAFGCLGFISLFEGAIGFPRSPPVPIVASCLSKEKPDGQVHREEKDQTQPRGVAGVRRPADRYRAGRRRSQEDLAGPVGVPGRRLHAVPEDPQFPLERDRADVQLPARDVHGPVHR